MPGTLFEGLLWVGMGVVATLLSARYNMGSVSDPGPGVLPFGLGLTLILLSIVFLFRVRRLVEPSEHRIPFGPRWRKVCLAVLFLGADALLMESVGYLLAVFLLVSVSMVIMEPRKWVSGLLLGSASSVASYLLFGVWLNVSLPKGLIYF